MGRHICAHVNGEALGTKVGTGSGGFHKPLSLLSMPPSSCLVKVCHQSKLFCQMRIRFCHFFIILKKYQMGIYMRTVWLCYPLIDFSFTFQQPHKYCFYDNAIFFTPRQMQNWRDAKTQLKPSGPPSGAINIMIFLISVAKWQPPSWGKGESLPRKGVSISYLIFSVISKL